MNMPDAAMNSTMIIYMEYEKQLPKSYRIKTIAVDKDRKPIADLRSETLVKAGDTYTYQITDSRRVIDDKYYFQNKWLFSYVDVDGKTVMGNVQPGDKAEINPVPIGKENSLAIVYMMYDTKQVEITPTPPPGDPTPKPPDPSPAPPLPEVVVPEPDFATLPFTEVAASGVIRADIRGSERFVATLGVPTTESLFGEVIATEYLLGYRFVKKVGLKYYPIKVKKDYILEWMTATPESAGGGKPVTETITVEQIVTVPRAYGYWEIENLECYQIENAVLNNYALPGGSTTIYPNFSYYSPPIIYYYHSADENYHIIPPKEVLEGITLPPQTITGEIEKPSIPLYNFSAEATWGAHMGTSKVKVRSDRLTFKGSIVISDEITETEAPDINVYAIPQCNSNTNYNVLYKPNQVIEPTKHNGTYNSNGTIAYSAIAKVRSNKPNTLKYSIEGINRVMIHTPVICNPSIVADNDKYVQLINPTEGAVQLVLDPDPNLSDFIVNISNTAHHSNKQGYYTRDFSKSLRDPSVSYITSQGGLLRNEVQFPFDVYVDIGNDQDTSNDNYIKAGTWVTIGRSSPRFYLPMWTEEGVYTVNFRTIAVNGENFLAKRELIRNTNLTNYVATESIAVEVSGRIYGMTMYDISDYPVWKEVFRVPESMRLKKDDPKYPIGTNKNKYSKGYSYTYTVGTNDQYGNDTGRNVKYTFPLVNGSHPYYSNIGLLKTGYLTRFSIETTGNMYADSCSVRIQPTFYFVDKEGKNRTAVDLYYKEEISGKSRHLVRMGSPLDLVNVKSTTTGNINLAIPEKELRQTAALRGITYGKLIAKQEALFTFTDIRMNYAFRTFVNEDYAGKIKSLISFQDVLARGIKEGDMIKTKQRWYGQYYLPNEVHAVQKGFDVMNYADKYGVDYNENFWLREGYIIVNFNIFTIDQNGNRRLSYTNAANYQQKGHCSMWIMEGPPLTKKDNKGVSFDFFAGDFIIYYANKRMSEEYIPGAIY